MGTYHKETLLCSLDQNAASWGSSSLTSVEFDNKKASLFRSSKVYLCLSQEGAKISSESCSNWDTHPK